MIAADSKTGTEFLPLTSQMGCRIRSFDWTSTPLGPIQTWSPSLKASLNLILSCREPMWLAWGPELTFFYNDAYISAIGPAKHASALGRPASEVWAHVWSACGPVVDKVLQTGEPAVVEGLPGSTESSAFEGTFSFSYSPLRDESGHIAGIFCPFTDMGPKILEGDCLKTPSELLDARDRIAEVLRTPTARNAADDERAVLLLREREAREEAETLNLVARSLAGEVDLHKLVQTATDAATKLTAAEFGAFFYNVRDENDESYVLYTISGAPREAFEKFPLPRNTAIFDPTFRGTHIVRSDDILKHPNYGKNAPHFGMPKGHLPVRSYLAVPVVSRSGEVLGGLFFGHSRTGVFQERSERLALAVASHAALAIDNARLLAKAEHQTNASLLLSAIVDSSDDAIVSKDLTGIVTSWNKGAERLFGYTAAEAVGRSITLIIPPDRLAEEPEILRRLQRGERVDHFETIRRRKDGTLLNISLTISPVRNKAGKIIGASKIARDITERKRAEAALLASEHRFRQLADSMPQIVWTARPDGSLDYYNNRWYELTGFARDTSADSSWDAILHPEDLSRWRQSWKVSVDTGAQFQMEYRFWDRHENRWRWFIGRALAVRDSSTGELVKWFGTCTDIDDQKRVQDELRQANEDLEQFAYSASHDLQEPLRGIKIYSELLSRRFAPKLDGQALQFLDYLAENASRMDLLVRDLLDYTQITRLNDPIGDVDANQALGDVLANLQGAILESGARISSDPLPSVRMHDMHLKQLFQNLIGNAIKYRHEERVPTIHVSSKGKDSNWLFSVTDNGIGIEPEYKERIFGLFKRLHTRDEYSGTGIGLAICQRIVDRYHGRIWVESVPGQGSRFMFTIPV